VPRRRDRTADGVDLREGPEQRRDARDDEQESCRLGHEDREHRRTHDVLLGTALARELGVLLTYEQEEVRTDQSDDDERHDQTVQDEEPRNDRGPGKLPPKTQNPRYEPTSGIDKMIE